MKVDFSAADPGASLTGFLGATALGILAFKGFTTITNSGSELKAPHRNLGNAIMISIALCVVIYALVGFAVSSNLSLGKNRLRSVGPHRGSSRHGGDPDYGVCLPQNSPLPERRGKASH